MAKFTDVIRDVIISNFNAGDQPTEAQFTNWITRIQEGIEEHDHDGTGDGDGINHFTGSLGIGAAPGAAHLLVYDATVDVAATFYGLRASHTKTAGATDHNDVMYGGLVALNINDPAQPHGYTYGLDLTAVLTDGEIGAAANARWLLGVRALTQQGGGKIWGDLIGAYYYADQNAGEVTGDVKAMWLRADVDGTVGGTVYMLYIDELTGVDYGIYQSGSADNYLGGPLVVHSLITNEGAELTIDAAGAITVVDSFHSVDTEDDDPADDLVTINGGSDGHIVILKTASSTRDVTVKETGNIALDAAGDFLMNSAADRIILQHYGGSWYELSRSNNS